MERLYLKALLGTVRTVVKEGKDEITRHVHLSLGDPIPDTVPADEIERLKRTGAIGPKAAVKVVRDQSQGNDRQLEGAGKKPNEKKPAKPVDLSNLGSLEVDELAKVIAEQKPGAKKLLAAVGSDVEFAGRMLEAEKKAASELGGEPRKQLTADLTKLLGGSA